MVDTVVLVVDVDVLVVFGYCNQYADLGLPMLVPGPSESPVIVPTDPIGPFLVGPPIPPVVRPLPIGIARSPPYGAVVVVVDDEELVVVDVDDVVVVVEVKLVIGE